ncbi:MAG: hypothetical protein RR540_07105, partial [Oscillospiraceae bacterium]
MVCGGRRSAGVSPLRRGGGFVLRYDLLLPPKAVSRSFRRYERQTEHFVLRYDLLLLRSKSRQKSAPA